MPFRPKNKFGIVEAADRLIPKEGFNSLLKRHALIKFGSQPAVEKVSRTSCRPLPRSNVIETNRYRNPRGPGRTPLRTELSRIITLSRYGSH
jgi:hypothetical protein